MENNQNNEGFRYTYSAKEQAELKKIRQKYAPEETAHENKMERLHKLDRGVTQKAQAAALSVGIIGALILGLGMSFIMTDLGEQLGDMTMPVGIIVGIVGGILVCLAYPIYNMVLRHERKKAAPEIMKLTDELMK